MRSTLASLILGAATLGTPAYAGGEGATVTVESGAAKRPCPSKDQVVNSQRPLIQSDEAYVIARPGLAERPWCVGEAVPQDACGEGAYDGMVCATPITKNTVWYDGAKHKVAPGTVSNDLETLCEEEKQICIDESGLTLIPRPRPTRAPTPVDRTPRVAPNAAPVLTVGSYGSIRDVEESFVVPLTVKDDGKYDLLVSNGSGATVFYNQNEGVNTHPVDLLKLGKLPAGTHTYTASVSDGHNPKVTQTFDLEVLANGAPTISGEPMIEVKKGETVSYTVTITDPENDKSELRIDSQGVGLAVKDLKENTDALGTYTLNVTATGDVGSTQTIEFHGKDEFGAKADPFTLEVKVTAATAATVPPPPTEPTVPEYQNLQPNTLQGVWAWTGRDSRFAGLEYTRDLVPKSKWQLRLGAGAGVLFGNDITPTPKAVNIMSEPYSQGHSGEELVHEIDNGNLVYHVWETAYQDELQKSWNTPASATWDVRVPALVGTPYFGKKKLNVAAGAMAEIVGPRNFDGTKTMQTYHDTPGHLELRAADGVTVLDENFGEMGTESGTFDPKKSDISRKVPVQVYVLPRAEFNFKPLGEDSEHSPAITLGATYSLRTRTPSAYLSAGWKW